MVHGQIERACEAVASLRSRVEAEKLSLAVYHEVYARGDFPPHRALWDIDFVNSLMKVTENNTQELIGSLYADKGDTLVVEIDGIRVSVPSARATSDGANVRVRVQQASIAASPGHVWLSGSRSTEPLTLRLYMAISPSAAATVLSELAERLEVVTEGWWAGKVLAHPQHYSRADAAVIYVRQQDLHVAYEASLELFEERRLELRDLIPTLTRPLGRGISAAFDPPDRTMSYGQWITQLLVKASGSADDINAAAAKFRELVAEDGRPPNKPWALQDDDPWAL